MTWPTAMKHRPVVYLAEITSRHGSLIKIGQTRALLARLYAIRSEMGRRFRCGSASEHFLVRVILLGHGGVAIERAVIRSVPNRFRLFGKEWFRLEARNVLLRSLRKTKRAFDPTGFCGCPQKQNGCPTCAAFLKGVRSCPTNR